jgi:hypothetical protein
MLPLTQLLVGAAVGGMVSDAPAAMAVGAAAGIAPDVIDGWRRLWERPTVTVAPDPLAPDAAMLAAGVAAGLRQAAVSGAPCRVRLHPLPRADGGFCAYALDVNARHRLTLSIAADPPLRASVNSSVMPSLRLPLPFVVTERPRTLLIMVEDGRLVCRDRALVAGCGHAWSVAAVLALAFWAVNADWGRVASAALGLHLVLDAAGLRAAQPFWPWRATLQRGWGLWPEAAPRANLLAALAAAGALLWRALA